MNCTTTRPTKSGPLVETTSRSEHAREIAPAKNPPLLPRFPPTTVRQGADNSTPRREPPSSSAGVRSSNVFPSTTSLGASSSPLAEGEDLPHPLGASSSPRAEGEDLSQALAQPTLAAQEQLGVGDRASEKELINTNYRGHRLHYLRGNDDSRDHRDRDEGTTSTRDPQTRASLLPMQQRHNDHLASHVARISTTGEEVGRGGPRQKLLVDYAGSSGGSQPAAWQLGGGGDFARPPGNFPSSLQRRQDGQGRRHLDDGGDLQPRNSIQPAARHNYNSGKARSERARAVAALRAQQQINNLKDEEARFGRAADEQDTSANAPGGQLFLPHFDDDGGPRPRYRPPKLNRPKLEVHEKNVWYSTQEDAASSSSSRNINAVGNSKVSTLHRGPAPADVVVPKGNTTTTTSKVDEEPEIQSTNGKNSVYLLPEEQKEGTNS
eukprot:GSA25T00006298001.1